METPLDNAIDPQSVRNHGQIVAILKRLLKDRTPLTVRIPGHRGEFRSALLAVDGSGATLQLDELAPQRGHNHLAPGMTLRVISAAGGVETKFTVAIHSIEISDDIYYYIVGMPDEVHYHQRRQFVRVRVPPMRQGTVTLTDESRHLELSLEDLSAGGIGAYVEHGGETRRGESFHCHIELAGESPIDCDVEIRFARQDKLHRKQRIGAQFMGLKTGERQRIERVVSRLQRELLRQT